MKMSVREARANFAHALELAEKGEAVIITKNGKAVAELGPPKTKVGFDWARAEQWRKDHGFHDHDAAVSDKVPFTGPEWTQEVWGEYFEKLDKEFEPK